MAGWLFSGHGGAETVTLAGRGRVIAEAVIGLCLAIVAIGPLAACTARGTSVANLGAQCAPASTANSQAEVAGSFGTRVAAIGQPACIAGHGFGAKSGQVLFFAPPNDQVSGRIESWSNTIIKVVVPASAATGPVQGVTATGELFYVGPLIIEGTPNGVSRITYRPISPAVASQTVTVTLTAISSSGRPVRDVVISFTDGLGTLFCTSDTTGTCSLAVTGYASDKFVALSGTAWTEVSITWLQPPNQTMSLTSSSSALLVGGTVTVTATVKTEHGDPIPNQAVTFSAGAPATLSAAEATTDASGMATITATSAAPGYVVIDAETNYYANGKAIGVDWAPALVTGVSPNHGPSAGGTHVTVSGSGFTSSATVYFGTKPATSLTLVNSSTLIAVAPAGSGQIDVRVVLDNWGSPPVPEDMYSYGG